MLAVLAVEGLVHQVRVDQDIRVADVLLLEVLLVVDMFALARRLLGRLDVALSRHDYDVRTVCRRQRGVWGKKERQGQEDWATARTRMEMGERTLTLTRPWRLEEIASRLHRGSVTLSPQRPCFAAAAEIHVSRASYPQRCLAICAANTSLPFDGVIPGQPQLCQAGCPHRAWGKIRRTRGGLSLLARQPP